MQGEGWGRVKQIVNACLEMEPGQRASCVAELCAGDVTLIAEVQSLLDSHAEMGDFLTDSILESADGQLLIGRQIGPYQLCEPIGEGGMGVVYRAVRTNDFAAQVAIKLVKPGIGTNFVLRRFRDERQILAGLDHPNIARLMDGGATADGWPYLVMELVYGEPIDQYCDTRTLPTVERLRLFRTVCAAVYYAHQRLIVHRDLKPGNILVTGGGTVKLLDFGIAKIVEPESAPQGTATLHHMMTPQYASPEQVQGGEITTATDVYSLGVVLYALLTGHLPHPSRGRTPMEMAQAICNVEPLKPSAAIDRVEEVTGATLPLTPEYVSGTRDGQPEKLRRRLAGDLDNIVLKALAKDPYRRYSSVEQFSEDIEQYLQGRPVIARKATLAYRTRKFVMRHIAGVAAATLVLLTLVAGLLITLREARIAHAQEARAENRFNQVRKLANSLLFEIHDGVKELPGSTAVRKLIVDRAREYLDSLAQESAGDVSLQREIASAYERLGLVQGEWAYANLGDSEGALRSFQKDAEIRQRIADATRHNFEDALALVAARRRVALQLMATGALDEALVEIQKAVKVAEGLLPAAKNNFIFLKESGHAYQILGQIQFRLEDSPGSLLSYQKALVNDQAMVEIDPGSEATLDGLEYDTAFVGSALNALGDKQGALTKYQRSLEIAEEVLKRGSTPHRQRGVAVACNRLALLYEDLGNFDLSLKFARRNLEIYESLARGDPKNALAQEDVSRAYLNVGNALVKTGDIQLGLDSMDQGIRLGDAAAATYPSDAHQLELLGQYYELRGEARAKIQMMSGSVDDFKKALVIFQRQIAKHADNTFARIEAANCYRKIGTLAEHAGKLDQAEVSYGKAVELTEGRSNPGALHTAADSYSGLGNVWIARASNPKLSIADRKKLLANARSSFQHSLSSWHAIPRPATVKPNQLDGSNPKNVAQQLAYCDLELGKLQDAAKH